MINKWTDQCYYFNYIIKETLIELYLLILVEL